jgi:hypothetical protein
MLEDKPKPLTSNVVGADGARTVQLEVNCAEGVVIEIVGGRTVVVIVLELYELNLG